MNWIHLKETDSTNRYLAELLRKEGKALPEGTLVWADYQTAGRGQSGAWVSAPGENLTFSLLLRPDLAVTQQFLLSETVALAMKGVLDKHVAGVSVKWPNDLYIGERKACGILIENNLLGPVVSESIIGTGLNLNQRTFAAEAAPLAVSLAQATGQTFEREAILQDFCAQFKHFYQMAKKEPETLHANYMQSLYRREGLQAWHSEAEGDFRARIRTVDGFGRLLLEKEDGRLSAYAFKEVSYRFACE